MSIEIRNQHRVHGGTLRFCQHASEATRTPMRFSAFTPPGEGPFPYLIFLSGLTSSEENFTVKAGAYRFAAEAGLAILNPDTSPRGENVPDHPDPDVGQAAGFYVDATEAPWSANFKMETYVTRDLIAAAEGAFPLDPARRGLCGHSMGGHGALTLAFRHPDCFQSLSAFAPICSPTRSTWGGKAFREYFGADEGRWRGHDATLLLEQGAGAAFDDILIDQGLADPFLPDQLNLDRFEAAARAAGRPLTVRRHEGYDHGYFFITTFIADHIAFHAQRLRQPRAAL
ncbi:MAG TPA: S-formylglutathione hydrolase [Caulobacterales bacterium]|nr:S-formylglutathione hydrolase [Caulobacterales bacterium]